MSRAQLRALGLERGGITHRLELRRFHAVHRGVYAVGRRRLTRLGILMAAVLACGPGAVLSHRAAAVLWAIRRGCPTHVDVTAARRLKRRDGIRAHHATLQPDEIIEIEGIPATTAARTLLDLAAESTDHELERAIEQAEALRLSDSTPLVALVERYPHRAGVPAIKAILNRERRAAGITRSELEDAFLASSPSASCRAPSSTRGCSSTAMTGSRPTASGGPSGSWPSSTAGRTTATSPPSGATGPATGRCGSPAGGRCA